MQTIEDWALDTLDALALTPVAVLMHNPRKGRYIIEAKTAWGRRVVAKLNSEENALYCEKLKWESAYYAAHPKSCFLPRMLVSARHALVLEKLDIISLREYALSDKNDWSAMAISIEACLTMLLQDEVSDSPEHSFGLAAYRQLYSLLCSGPWNTENRSSKRYTAINRYVMGLYSADWFERLALSMGGGGLVHGDFHLNNIAIEPASGRVVVFDWENAHIGYWVIDFASCWAQLAVLLQRKPKAALLMHAAFTNALQLCGSCHVHVFEQLSHLYIDALQMNPRYHNKNHRCVAWVRGLYKLVFTALHKQKEPGCKKRS